VLLKVIGKIVKNISKIKTVENTVKIQLKTKKNVYYIYEMKYPCP